MKSLKEMTIEELKTERNLARETRKRFVMFRDGKGGEVVPPCTYCKEAQTRRKVAEQEGGVRGVCYYCRWREACKSVGLPKYGLPPSQRHNVNNHILTRMTKYINGTKEHKFWEDLNACLQESGGTLPDGYDFANMPTIFQNYVLESIQFCKSRINYVNQLLKTRGKKK